MADIPQNYTITTAGTYVVPPMVDSSGHFNAGLCGGERYLLTAKMAVPTDAAISVAFNNGPNGDFLPVDNPDMLGDTGITERRFMSPSDRMQLTVTGDEFGPIKITVIRDIQAVK